MDITQISKGDKVMFTMKSGEVLTSRVYRVIDDPKHPIVKVHDPRYGMRDEFISVLADQIRDVVSQVDEINKNMNLMQGPDMEL